MPPESPAESPAESPDGLPDGHRSQVGLRGQFEQRGDVADGYLEWVDLGVRPDLNRLLIGIATYANAYAERFEATLTTNDTPYARDT